MQTYRSVHIEDIWDSLLRDIASDPYTLLCTGQEIILRHLETGMKIDILDYLYVKYRNETYEINGNGLVGYEMSDSEMEDFLYLCADSSVHDNNVYINGGECSIHLVLP